LATGGRRYNVVHFNMTVVNEVMLSPLMTKYGWLSILDGINAVLSLFPDLQGFEQKHVWTSFVVQGVSKH
jgi:hypothetical protein